MTLRTDDVKIRLDGATKAPADIVEAARQSLSAEGFAELMATCNGSTPTPGQVVAIADRERAAAESAGSVQ